MVNVNEFLNVIISSLTQAYQVFFSADRICVKKKGYVSFFEL